MYRKRVGTVVAYNSKKRKEHPSKQPASGQGDRFFIKIIGKSCIAVHEKRTQSKQFQLLCAFLAAAKHPQVIHLPAGRSLPGTERIPQKCEACFRQKSRENTYDQDDQNPRRKKEDACSQADCGDDFLNQSTGGLNHSDAVSALHARTLKLVVEKRVFKGHQIERRRMVHNTDVDVAGKLVGKQAIAE